MEERCGDRVHERKRYGGRTRTVTPPLPVETARTDGLAYTLWLPPGDKKPPRAGVVVLHGAGSCKESHHDFARAAIAYGLAAITFDQRGHGASEGPMDGRMVHDVTVMGQRLRSAIGDQRAPMALRGSSMGGYLAIIAAAAVDAQAVVAICPASAAGLRRGLNASEFSFQANVAELNAFLDGHELEAAVRELAAPLLILHAEGDERVPVEQSRELSRVMSFPGSRLIVVAGGHHRSIQHDEELQGVSLQFLARALGLRRRPELD